MWYLRGKIATNLVFFVFFRLLWFDLSKNHDERENPRSKASNEDEERTLAKSPGNQNVNWDIFWMDVFAPVNGLVNISIFWSLFAADINIGDV